MQVSLTQALEFKHPVEFASWVLIEMAHVNPLGWNEETFEAPTVYRRNGSHAC